MIFSRSRQPSGLILLVVLSMLAFLGVLVITYISFSSKSRRTSYALASREFHAPDVDHLFDEALMKLVRGTDDNEDPFFGEDLLSDLYGRRDGFPLEVMRPMNLRDAAGSLLPGRRPVHVGGGYVRFPVNLDAFFSPPRPTWTFMDDAFAGRVITFKDGPLQNRSFRVLKSTGARGAGTSEYVNTDSFFIELDPTMVVTLGNGDTIQIDELISTQGGGQPPEDEDVAALFYSPGPDGFYGTPGDDDGDGNPSNYAEAGFPASAPTPTVQWEDIPYELIVNPTPQNSPGLGLSNGKIQEFRNVAGAPVPISFFPNSHDGTATIDKSMIGGDFDEAYDAPDYFNMFMAGRVRVEVEDTSGNTSFESRVIPSFHRPALINYLVNLKDWSNAPSDPTATHVDELVDAIRRATYRPLPFPTVNRSFSGGSSDFGLTTPIDIPRPNFDTNPLPTVARLDLLARVLTQGPWDVDNDGDGIPDSIWMDVGLPLITSPEGKLLRPLIAPMIEDTGGKLNLNAVGNYTQTADSYYDDRIGTWAGTNTNNGARHVFRGLGYGPADIVLPSHAVPDPSNPPATPEASAMWRNELVELLRRRNAWGMRQESTFPVAGTIVNDALNALLTGHLRGTHTAAGGVGFSSDPFGRGGVGVGRSGQLLAADSGTQLEPAAGNQPLINETVNDPYERDPTGRLGGDNAYMLEELEAILRSNSWDNELLPARLRNLLQNSLDNKAELARMLTTISTSFDHPSRVPPQGDRAGYDTPAQLAQVLLSRFRLDTVAQGQSPPSDQTEDRSAETPAAYRNRLYNQGQRLYQVLGPELLQGRKLDVNRPFGNGRDDNGNGVIDEPLEFGTGTDTDMPNNGLIDEVSEFYAGLGLNPHPLRWNIDAYPQASSGEIDGAPGPPVDDGPIQSRFGNPPPDYNFIPDYNFGLRDPDLSASGRELLARHLYVLMMAMMAEFDPTSAISWERYPLPIIEPDPIVDSLRQEYTAHRIAQWAVNVVDYRDADSIMTRFSYDPKPLDGWDIAIDTTGDGNSNRFVGNASAATHPTASPVVWGVESPELILSESLALHDVRVRDTNHDDGPGAEKPDQDPNTDQIRLPQGSLFLELYCPRNQITDPSQQSSNAGVPQELYSVNATTGEAFLDLNRVAPGGAPVWRIAISEPHPNFVWDGVNRSSVSPRVQQEQLPNTYSFELNLPNPLDPRERPNPVEPPDNDPVEPPDNDDPLRFERYIWFTSYDDVGDIQSVIANNNIRGIGNLNMRPEQVFFAPARNVRDNSALNANRQLMPGQYLTLAPRGSTILGSREENIGTYPGVPSQQRFNIVGSQGVVQFDHGDRRMTPTLGPAAHHIAARPLIIGSFTPTVDTLGAAWADTAEGGPEDAFDEGFVGLSVSEPLWTAYYPQPPFVLNGDEDQDMAGGVDYQRVDAFVDFEVPANTAPDTPFDVDPDVNGNRIPNDGNEPRLGTTPDYCSAFLQRLADPTRRYHPVFNPYRTVDWLTIDLTVFSGEEREGEVVDAPGRYAQRSRQRNGHVDGVTANVLFSYETNDPLDVPTNLDSSARDYFAFTPVGMTPGDGPHLYSSLSFLNTASPLAGSGYSAAQGGSNPSFQGFARSLGSGSGPQVEGTDRNQPTIPFSLHPWLNRPFASHLELMMVPATSAGRLFEEFTPTTPAVADRYHPRVAETVQPPSTNAPSPNRDDPPANAIVDADVFHGPHRHLMNFFQASELENNAAQFTRLFDYVTTLPRFRGEIDLINPARVTLQAGNSAAATGSRIFGRALQSPFNFMHDGRRQGQINLNTLSDYPVWVGLMHGHLLATELGSPENDETQQLAFQKFQRSRRGYPVEPIASGNPPRRLVAGGSINSNAMNRYNYAPDQLDGNFPTQYAGIYRHVADADMAPLLPEVHGQTPKLGRAGIAASLLRPDANSTAGWSASSPRTAFFVRESMNQPHRNVERNPFAHYQTLMRMPNLVTKESHVFIVRITMGLFEVDPTDINSLGREYKEELAQNERYQMLYIIDRSKPVAFVPGEDWNARDVVIYERRLQ